MSTSVIWGIHFQIPLPKVTLLPSTTTSQLPFQMQISFFICNNYYSVKGQYRGNANACAPEVWGSAIASTAGRPPPRCPVARATRRAAAMSSVSSGMFRLVTHPVAPTAALPLCGGGGRRPNSGGGCLTLSSEDASAAEAEDLLALLPLSKPLDVTEGEGRPMGPTHLPVPSATASVADVLERSALSANSWLEFYSLRLDNCFSSFTWASA